MRLELDVIGVTGAGAGARLEVRLAASISIVTWNALMNKALLMLCGAGRQKRGPSNVVDAVSKASGGATVDDSRGQVTAPRRRTGYLPVVGTLRLRLLPS